MEELRKRAIRKLKDLLSQGWDYQAAIEDTFNSGSRFTPLFEGMSDDERFADAYDMLADAEYELNAV